MIDPLEVERYESPADYVAIGAGIILLILVIAFATLVSNWNPDVEAIGTWISNLIN